MARKSTDFSLSLFRFQNANKEKADDGREVQRSDNEGKQENEANDEEMMDSLRTKYTLQNKALAKNNSLMLSRISDMESKISDLINENMQLRKTRTNRDQKAKHQMEERLQRIESKLYSKFADIFEYLKQLRAEEGLSVNPQLSIFDESFRPMTSTPKRANSPFFNHMEPETAFSFGGNTEKAVEYNIGDSAKSKSVIQETTEDCGNSTIMEVDENSSMQGKSTEISEQKQGLPLSDNRRMGSFAVFLDEIPEVKKTEFQPSRIFDQNSSLERAKKKRKSRFDDDDEDEDDLNVKVASDTYQIQQESKEKQIKEKESKELSTNTKSSRSTKRKKAVLDSSAKNIDTDNQGDVRRSRRTRKEVNYVSPSLRAKMRRESEKLLDAVGDDVLINGVLVKGHASNEFTIKQEEIPTDLGKAETTGDEATKNKVTDKVLVRKPLSNVTNQMKTSEKKDKETKKSPRSDLSIFDFVDKPSKTYVGRLGVTKKQRKRHSMSF